MSILKIRNGSTWEEIPSGGVGVPSGGTAGQVLMKSSSTDYADEWHTLAPDDIGAMSTWELLWENASPTATFNAQTVSLDLSGYDMVCVMFVQQAGVLNEDAVFVWVGEKAMAFLRTTNNSATAFVNRTFSTSTSGITFDTAINPQGNGNNGYCIPHRILGIKGVQ